MKRIAVMATVLTSLVLIGTWVWANPGMLPKHPGYPMAASKDPVMGVPTANDPGEKAPSPEEALKQAGQFHDAHARNPMKENRPNVVHDFKESGDGAPEKQAGK